MKVRRAESRVFCRLNSMRLLAERSFNIGKGKVVVLAPHNNDEAQLWWVFYILEVPLNAEFVV